MNEYGALVEWH